MTEEHISLAMAFGVPTVIVVNKIDLASQVQIANTIDQLKALISQPHHRKVRERLFTAFSYQ